MPAYYLGIIRATKDDATTKTLAFKTDLYSFSRFTRGSYEEFICLFAKTVAGRQCDKPDSRTTIVEGEYKFHVTRRGDAGNSANGTLMCVLVTTREYKELPAHQHNSQVLDDFMATWPKKDWSTKDVCPFNENLTNYLSKFQDPDADGFAKVQKELDETKVVLQQTIESVLERGEKIDSLVAKSDGLSAQSKMFYTQAKKQNSCCIVM